MASHASAAEPLVTRARGGTAREAARRLYADGSVPLLLVLAGTLTASAFIANGGLQLGSSTLVEVAVVLIGAALVAASLLAVGLAARVHGGLALSAFVAIWALSAVSIAWSLHPSDSWVETNRTLAYVAAFAAGVAAVRLARGRWPAIAGGVLLALAAICAYGLATKVAPGWLAEDELYGRLREPYGYWNAVGVTAAMGMPLCLWLGTREGGRRIVNAIAWPLLAVLIVTMLLSFSRGSIVAALVGLGLWLALVPLRLRSLAILVPAGLAAGAVTAWAFAKDALTDDRIALAAREDAGVELGLLLAAMIAVLLAAGVLIQRRAEDRPLSEPTRRRIGIAALAALAAVPVIGLGGLALSDRGIGGTISDRWNDLTEVDAVTPQNSPGRLTETASVRSIYWRRAVDVWEQHKVAGAGAGAFAEAQLRFREEEARAKHAHGYVLQTLADLGLIGLAVSLAALIAWSLAARQTLALRRGRVAAGASWSPERAGLAAVALVAIVFGVHSAVDWTWFVPGVAMTGLFCAGWVAGRGPLLADATGGTTGAPGPALAAVEPGLPRGPRLGRRGIAAALAVALGVLGALAVAQPWRSQEKGEQALHLIDERDFAGARAAAERAKDLNPLSVEPYFELAAIAGASGQEQEARAALERAVQVEPARAEAWRRLGDYYLRELGQPALAVPVLRGALFLDPLSEPARASFVTALRAAGIERAEAMRPRRATPRR